MHDFEYGKNMSTISLTKTYEILVFRGDVSHPRMPPC